MISFLISKKVENKCLDFLKPSEHFIPVRFDLILHHALKTDRLSDDQKQKFKTFGEMLLEHYHVDYHKRFLDMKNWFACFEVDRETIYEEACSPEQREEYGRKLVEGIDDFLTSSNYSKLSDDEFNECLKQQPFSGLNITVNTEDFEYFKVYYRGIREIEERKTFLYVLAKKVRFQELKRVFILARYKTEKGGGIIVKMFRDIAVPNLKVVAPEVRLNLPMIDKFKIGGTFMSSLILPLVKVVMAAGFGLFLFVMLLVPTLSALMKSVFGFLNSRTRCMQVYSSNLYHKTMANNVGALNQLVDQAETQEVKEAFLAYYMLFVEKDRRLTMEELDECVEHWLAENFLKDANGFFIDFEVDDALRKLIDKKLVVKKTRDPDGAEIYRVYDIECALRRLDEIWDNLHTENNNEDASTDHLVA